MKKFAVFIVLMLMLCSVASGTGYLSTVDVGELRRADTPAEVMTFGSITEKFGRQIVEVLAASPYLVYTAEIKKEKTDVYIAAETDVENARAAVFINDKKRGYFRIGFPTGDGKVMFDIADISWTELKVYMLVEGGIE